MFHGKAPIVKNLGNHVLLPGLFNAHTHTPMTNMRGLVCFIFYIHMCYINIFLWQSDDKPLMEWLAGHIWPVEGKFMSPDFVREGSLVDLVYIEVFLLLIVILISMLQLKWLEVVLLVSVICTSSQKPLRKFAKKLV